MEHAENFNVYVSGRFIYKYICCMRNKKCEQCFAHAREIMLEGWNT